MKESHPRLAHGPKKHMIVPSTPSDTHSTHFSPIFQRAKLLSDQRFGLQVERKVILRGQGVQSSSWFLQEALRYSKCRGCGTQPSSGHVPVAGAQEMSLEKMSGACRGLDR